MKKKKVLSLVLAATIGLSTLIPNVALADTKDLNVTRISGKDKYETSVETSRKTFDSSKYAIIASGEVFPDALVGGTLASQVEAPIFLTSKNSISKNIFTEMKRIGVEHVFILGGTGTISSMVENNIKKLGYNVERLAGKDRVETATIIGEKRLALMGDHKQGMLPAAVNGIYFADALSAAPLVGQMFSDKDTPLTYLVPYMTSMVKPGFSMVFGGTSSVPKGIEEYRYAGSDRYETAVKVADAYPIHLNKEIETIVLVDGTEFPDALSSAPVASINNGAILLTHPTNFTKVTKDYINYNDNIKNVIIVGGENSVSKNIEKELKGEIITPPIVEENNFDKLDKGLQAFIYLNIANDRRLNEYKDLGWLSFYYEYDANYVYCHLTSNAGSGHPIYRFEIKNDRVTYLDAVISRAMEGYETVKPQPKTMTKSELYNEYLKYKSEYDIAAKKIKEIDHSNPNLIEIFNEFYDNPFGYNPSGYNR